MATPTMECPACNRRLIGELRDDHTYDFKCASCGWGSEPLASSKIPTDIQRIKWRILPYWILSLGFLLLGYWLCSDWEILEEYSPIAVYLLVLLPIYLGISWLIKPEFDLDTLGNPFSWNGDYDRFMLFLGIILWPGKFMIFTAQFTLAVWRGK